MPKNFTINCQATWNKVLELVEINTFGTAFLVDECNKIVGSITDGDVRRHLLNNGQVDDLAMSCVNKNYCFVTEDTSPEVLAKYFDRIRVIPLLDQKGNVTEFLTGGRTAEAKSRRLFSRSKTPVRISFSGGGSGSGSCRP